jgi:hypothetical protein
MSEETFADRVLALRAELKSYGNDINQHLNHLYSKNYNVQIDLTINPLNTIPMLQNDVLDLLKEAKKQNDDHVAMREELKQCEELIRIMKLIADVVDAIEVTVKYSSSSDIVKTCESMKTLEDKLNVLPSELGAGNTFNLSSKVVMLSQVLTVSLELEYLTATSIQLLRKEARLLKYQFGARMKRLIKSCYEVTCGKIQVNKLISGVIKGEDDIIEIPIKLSDIWNALVMTKQAEAVTADIVHLIWTFIFTPLWKEKKISPPKVTTDESTSSLTFESIMKMLAVSSTVIAKDHVSKETLSSCRIPVSQLMDFLGQVLSFLWSEVFCAHEDVIELMCIALYNNPTYSLRTILEDTIMHHLPRLESEVAGYQRLLDKPARDLQQKLKTLRLLPLGEDTAEVGFLVSIISELTAKFITERRKDVLSRARDIILADYHNVMSASGDAQEDEPSSAGDIGDQKAMHEQSGSFQIQALRFDPCQVSLASCRILKLLHEVLREACGSTPDLARLLYYCARDCLELFLAIVPVKFAHIMSTVPRMGAVFFNDCSYMAHNCTLISHLYRAELGIANAGLLETSGLIDYIPRFRMAGEEVLAAHLHEQRQTLEALVMRIRLSPGGEEEEEEEGRRQVNDEEGAGLIVRHMQKLTGQWQGVLQESVYERLQGHLVESTLRACMSPLLEVHASIFSNRLYMMNGDSFCSVSVSRRVHVLI